MSDLNDSLIVQRIRALLDEQNRKNDVVGMNDHRVVERLDAELVTVLSEASQGSKSLREVVAAILKEYPKTLPLP